MTGTVLEHAQSPGDQGPSGTELSLRGIWDAVVRRWWIAACVFIVIVSLGVWRTLSKTPLYRATATVRVSQQQAPIQGLQAPTGYQDFRIDRLAAEMEVIRSVAVAERVADSLGLRLIVKHPPETRRSTILGPFIPRVDSTAREGEYRLVLGAEEFSLIGRAGPLGTARYGDTLVAEGITLSLWNRPGLSDPNVVLEVISLPAAGRIVQSSMSTAVVEKTDIIAISALLPDQLLAQQVANVAARQYATFSKEVMQNQAEAKTAFIETQLQQQRQLLSDAQDARKEFLERNNLTNVATEQAAISARIYALEADRQASVLERESHLKLLGEMGKSDTTTENLRRLVGSGQVSSNAAVKSLTDRWFMLSSERQKLTSGNRNVILSEVAAIDSQIAVTKRELQTAVDDYFVQLNSRINSYDSQLASLRVETGKYPGLAADEARLASTEKTLQTLYDNLQAQHQLARIAEAVEMDVVRQIDAASFPIMPETPNRRQDAFLAAALGVLLGIAVAVLLDRLDDSVRSPDDIAQQLSLPVLGMIPAIKLEEAAKVEGSTIMERLVTHANPRSPVAEAYRSLRTNLAFARAREEIKTLVLTSPGPADGKSTTVANLAITFAQQGQRTLLVDADLRRAVLDKTFSVPRSPGLTEVIVGEAELERAVHPTDVPNLYVLGSGHFPPNPSELLGSTAMQNVLREAKEQFDVILFDSPPLLAVTDAAVLATMVDGTVLVVRMGSTARQAVRRALGQLKAVHAYVLGAVMNDVDLRRSSYYGGYGYAYYAYYGSEANGNGGHNGVMDRLRRVTNWTAAGPRGK